jgi:hypothetical protein
MTNVNSILDGSNTFVVIPVIKFYPIRPDFGLGINMHA